MKIQILIYLVGLVAFGEAAVLDPNSTNDFKNFLFYSDRDTVMNAFREKCKSVVGDLKADEAIKGIEKGYEDQVECVSEIIDISVLKDDMNTLKAGKTGDVKNVIEKYCNKRAGVQECAKKYTETVYPCLDANESDIQNITLKIGESILDFICSQNGSQIRQFMDEEGMECVKSVSDPTRDCIFTGLKEITTAPKQQDFCLDLEKRVICIVNQLKTCSNPTSANIFESLFKFVQNQTDCPKK